MPLKEEDRRPVPMRVPNSTETLHTFLIIFIAKINELAQDPSYTELLPRPIEQGLDVNVATATFLVA